MKVSELFRQEFENDYYSRIDAEHPLHLYFGKESDGHFAMEFRGNITKKVNIQASNVIGFKHGVNEDGVTMLIIYLKDDNLLELFCSFCDDVIFATRNCTNDNDGYETIAKRYSSWKKMFATTRHRLDEIQIMGLIGELYFLREYMIPKYGHERALSAWSGQDYTKKDFSIGDDWYEVKAISSSKDFVKISSLEQLKSDLPGQLSVVSLEKMSSAFDGLSLNKIINEIYYSMPNDELKGLFLDKFVNIGYDFDKAYDEYVYKCTDFSHYRVDQTFPHLESSDSLSAIHNVKYEILVPQIQSYKIQ